MSLTLQFYWPLALLLVAPPVWWMPARTLTSFSARQLRLQAAARVAILALVAFALAQPALHRSSGRTSFVFAVDVSESVAPESIAAAARWIGEARASGAADSRVLAFGADVTPVEASASLTGGGLAVRREATDLGAAIAASAGAFAPDSVRRLVLLTDGRANAGDLGEALARAGRAGVRIFTVPAPPRATRAAWLESIDAPEEVTAGEPFAVEVTVGSQVEQAAAVEIRQAGRTLARQVLALRPGSIRVLLAPRVTAAGPQALEIALQSDADAEPGHHRRLALVARARPRVLYVESRAASARYLRRALEEGGFAVDVLAPEAMPQTASALDAYAAVILSDVARRDLDDGRMEALERYVSDQGGGLIMAGGEAMYGLEGFANTILERTLPITFRMKDKPDEFAMIIILDKSWSMAGQKIELAKEAAVAAVEVLPDRHRIGLVAFNDGLEWVVPLQPAANRERIIAAIRAIVPSGHTNLFPAIEETYRALTASKADMKHVLVLSDGRTYPDEYEALVTKMVEAKMTVSGVALGEDADRELLANLATWGRGRHYVVDNAVEVPQIFVKETQRATRSTFVEQPFRPIVKKPVEMLTGIDLATGPSLAGYARAQAKDTAEVILTAGEDEDPILVRWQYGLGRAVAFTSDLKDRWAHDWIAWRGYGKFWTQLVRDTLRREGGGGRDARPSMRVTREGDRARIVITTLDAGGAPRNLMPPRVEVAGPDGRASAVETRQTGPGVYEAEAPLGAGDYRFRLPGGADGRTTLVERVLAASPPLERRFMAPDEALLKAISRDTGGVFNPRPRDVVADRGDRVIVRTALWPWLAGLAAIGWLIDLALRRVRLFEELA
mgnify:FL=1